MASQKIGRYQFSVSDVLLIEQRKDFDGQVETDFNVVFRNGFKIALTAAEKEDLDKAMERESQIAFVAGIVANAQANRPKG